MIFGKNTCSGSNDALCQMAVILLAKTRSCFGLMKRQFMIHQVAASVSDSIFYQITLVLVITTITNILKREIA